MLIEGMGVFELVCWFGAAFCTANVVYTAYHAVRGPGG